MNKIVSLLIFISLGIFGLSSWKAMGPQDKSLSGIVTDTLKKDPNTGFILDQHYELLIAHCTACHEAKVVTNFKANREGWLEKIRWMQKTQKLWDLGEAEPKILDYLSKNYAPKQSYVRRSP
ncbi:MAG: hypothetical protein ACK44D_09950, partial [Bacteroidia bacterium]